MRWFGNLLVAALIAAPGFAFALPAEAQLGARPAEEWAVLLESGRRLDALAIEEVVRESRFEEGEIVADVGAGTGVFAAPIAEAVGPEGMVYAVEVDEGFLPIIEENAEAWGVDNVEPVLGAFHDPVLPRRDIGVAFIHDVLHHIENRADYLLTLATYMAPGSRIIVVDYDRSHPDTPHQDEPAMLIGRDEVDAWMQAAGFEPTREIDMFEEKFFVEYTRGG